MNKTLLATLVMGAIGTAVAASQYGSGQDQHRLQPITLAVSGMT